MTNEQTQFINIVGRFARGEDAVLSKDADLKALSGLGRIHNLSAVVCYALNHQILEGGFEDKASAKNLQRMLFQTVMLQTERVDLFNKLLDIFSDNAIEIILMKGSVLNRYYPDPMVRTFGDIDFLIKKEQRGKLHAVMIGQGYEHKVAEDTVWTYTKGCEKYEVHIALLPNREVLSEGMCEFIDSAFISTVPTEREHIFELEPSYHFAFSLLHTAKHMRATGAGARMYLDMALMVKNEPALNFDKIKKYAVSLGLSDFLDTSLYLTEKWFGIKAPINIKAPTEEVFSLMEEYIIIGGVFGFYERNPAVQRLRDEQRGRTKGSALLQYIFPSYKPMKNQYGFLKGKPFLLPVVWVMRWFDGIFLRRKKAARIFKGMFTEKNAAKLSEKMLQGIGIRNSLK